MKRRTLLYVFLGILSVSINLQAQETEEATQENTNADKANLGFGMGQDYGGFGVNLLVYPSKNFGIFGGLGYAFAGTGYNIGGKYRFPSKNNPRTNFFLMGMYGYNAAVKVAGTSEYDKFFYGPTFGFGMDTGKRSYKKSYWSIAVLIPIRDAEVDDYMGDLEDNYGVDFKSGLFPLTFSIGYRFGL